MGRIVIPRYQRQRAQLKQRPKGRGYFANGFGPQEMSLISKLTDLAVAGGGQIARAVQISNREEEQAKAQADYDRKIQANAEERRAAAQGLVDATDIDGQVEAFFAQQEPPSVRERLPSMSSMNLQSDLVQPRPMQAGALSPGVLARPGVLAPEDISALRSAAELMQHQSNMADQMRAAESVVPYMGTIGRAQVPARLFAHPESHIGQALSAQGGPLPPLAPDIARGSQLLYGDDPQVAAALGADPSLTYKPQTFGAADPYDAAQRRAELQQAMQGRDFRQEAISEIGPAPERKLFRIADILAAAPSARTEEQRAMLLQAAVDSPDIQAANLSDLAKGAYRDRAMQAVMKLFPEEEEALSEYELLRMQSMRESIETSNLRQQTLQAALDEEAAKAEKRANAVRRTDPRLAKKEALFAFYTANWPRKESGEMTEADWAAGAGELTKMTPSGLGAWTRNNRLSRATRKSVNATAGRLLQMRPKPDPQPKVPKVAKPPIASGLRKDLVQSKAEFREIVDELNALDADDPGREALQLELIRANQRRRDIEDQLGIISPKAVSGSGSSPEDPIRL